MSSVFPQAKPARVDPELDEQEAILLEKALVKLVVYGRTVGVTADEMIGLLDSGMSMSGLLAFLASKNSGAA